MVRMTYFHRWNCCSRCCIQQMHILIVLGVCSIEEHHHWGTNWHQRGPVKGKKHGCHWVLWAWQLTLPQGGSSCGFWMVSLPCRSWWRPHASSISGVMQWWRHPYRHSRSSLTCSWWLEWLKKCSSTVTILFTFGSHDHRLWFACFSNYHWDTYHLLTYSFHRCVPV